MDLVVRLWEVEATGQWFVFIDAYGTRFRFIPGAMKCGSRHGTEMAGGYLQSHMPNPKQLRTVDLKSEPL